ncbi:MAG: hypothetical protein WA919_18325 [Coleofasciculaceae cyanobacterium]
MKNLTGYTLTVLFSALVFPQQSNALTLAPPLPTQVMEVGGDTGTGRRGDTGDRVEVMDNK